MHLLKPYVVRDLSEHDVRSTSRLFSLIRLLGLSLGLLASLISVCNSAPRNQMQCEV